MNAIVDSNLLPAWDDPVHASQVTFRCVLNALAEPGTVRMLPSRIEGPAPFDASTTALCLALMDFETPVWCDAGFDQLAVRAYLRFHCGCPLTVDAKLASFALLSDPARLDLDHFAKGSLEYPDRSATLLVQVPTLVDGPVRQIAGPGIPHARSLCVGGLPADFNAMWHENVAGFPLGADIVFCCGNQIIGLPRTTHIRG